MCRIDICQLYFCTWPLHDSTLLRNPIKMKKNIIIYFVFSYKKYVLFIFVTIFFLICSRMKLDSNIFFVKFELQ